MTAYLFLEKHYSNVNIACSPERAGRSGCFINKILIITQSQASSVQVIFWGLMLLFDDFSDGFQVLIIPKLCVGSPLLGRRICCCSPAEVSPSTADGTLYEAAGLGPPLSGSLPVSLLQRGYVSAMMFSVAFPM